MKSLIVLILPLCSINLNAQSKEKLRVANQTYITTSGKKNFAVVTSDSLIHSKLMKNVAVYTIKRVYSEGECIHGYYSIATFYFKNEDYEKVKEYLNKLR